MSDPEKAALRQTIGFPERWLENKVFRLPQLRAAVRDGLGDPGSTYIGLCWNRVLIQNFRSSEFYIFYHPEKKRIFKDPAFPAGFRNTIWGMFPRHAAMLLHGAAAVIGQKAALFLAADEGGKTTAISQFDRENILNDDQVVLRKTKKEIRIHATPFGTMTCGNRSAPLGAIFLIHKSPAFRVAKAKRREILEFIWNEHMIHSILLPKKMRSGLFNLLCQAVGQTPVYHLFLKKGEIDRKAVARSLRA